MRELRIRTVELELSVDQERGVLEQRIPLVALFDIARAIGCALRDDDLMAGHLLGAASLGGVDAWAGPAARALESANLLQARLEISSSVALPSILRAAAELLSTRPTEGTYR
jgi:hypothetical protein